VLILDEPTAVLVPHEVEELFDNLRELKAEGLTVLFISHKLDEVLSVADDVTVIRRGTTVATVDPAATTARQLAELMVGSELPSPETRESTVTDEQVLRVEGLTVRDADGRAVVDDVSFVIHRGEVLGLAGVEGNGQAELVEALVGIRSVDAGRTALRGEDISSWHTRQRRERGIGYIPEDRHRHGLLLDAPLWRTACSDTRPRTSTSRARGSTGGEPAPTPADRGAVRRAYAGIDVLAPPCPAATSRSSSSGGR
jgi:simple sugar transport system ATP-binding protein